MTRNTAFLVLLGFGLWLALNGHYEAAAFVAVAAVLVALTGPSDEQADARRRNPARRGR